MAEDSEDNPDADPGDPEVDPTDAGTESETGVEGNEEGETESGAETGDEPSESSEAEAGTTDEDGSDAATDPLTDVEADTRTRATPDEGESTADAGDDPATDPLTEVDAGTATHESSSGTDATTGTTDATTGTTDATTGTTDATTGTTDARGVTETSETAPDEKYCSSCGEPVERDAEVCPNCGVRQTERKEKEPVLAALLSFIIPGAGQVYNGQIGRGAIAFFGAMILDFLILVVGLILTLIVIGPLLFLAIPVIHAVIMYDAYNQAELINQGKVKP